jgi:hypothetical protein
VLNGFIADDINAGTVAATGLAHGRNAGTYTSNLSVTGADAGNYNVTVTNADLVIDKKDATNTGAATTLTYNAATQSQDAAVLNGFIADDINAGTVAAAGLAHGRNAGTYTSNLSATGADAGNYNVTVTNADLVIDRKPIHVTGTQVADKMFDGNVSAAVTDAGVIQGLIGDEDLQLAAQARFSDASAGDNKPVSVDYSVQNGLRGQASNYVMPQHSAVVRAAIQSQTPTIPAPAVPEAPQTGPRVVVKDSLNAGGATNNPADNKEASNHTDTCSASNVLACSCVPNLALGAEVCIKGN